MNIMTGFLQRRLVLPMALGLVVSIGFSQASPAATEKTQPAPKAAPAPPVKSAQPTPPADAPYPALDALEREIARLADNARPSVVGVIARCKLEELLDTLGQSVRIEGH